MSIISKCVSRNEYWVECNMCGGKASNVYGTHTVCDDRTLPVLRIIFRGKGQRIDLCPECVRSLGARLDIRGVNMGGLVVQALKAVIGSMEECSCEGNGAQGWNARAQRWYCGYCTGWVHPVQPV